MGHPRSYSRTLQYPGIPLLALRSGHYLVTDNFGLGGNARALVLERLGRARRDPCQSTSEARFRRFVLEGVLSRR